MIHASGIARRFVALLFAFTLAMAGSVAISSRTVHAATPASPQKPKHMALTQAQAESLEHVVPKLATRANESKSAAGVPDCASEPDPYYDKCDYYVTYYDSTYTQATVDAGTNDVSPKTIKFGTTVTQTATNNFKPFFDAFGPVGMSGVGLGVQGTIVSISPSDGVVTDYSPTSHSVSWNGGPETNTGTNCNADPLVPCDGTPTSRFAAGQTFSVTYISNNINSGTEIDGASWGGLGGPGDFSQSSPVTLVNGPVASFTVTPNGRIPGQYSFVSDSTDDVGTGLTYAWDFGDGGKGTGAAITHNYTKPGTFAATLTVTDGNGQTSSVEHDVVVAAPTLTSSIIFVDSSGNPIDTVTPKIGDVVHYKITVAASQDGVGDLTSVKFVGDPLTLAVGSNLVTVAGPTPVVPNPLTLKPGDSQSFVYDLTVKGAGLVRGTTQAGALTAAGVPVVSDLNQLSFGVSSLVVSLTVNPPTYKVTEDADGNKQPIDVTVTEKLTNTSDTPIYGINVRSLAPGRLKSGQLLDVTYKSGINPDPTAGYPLDGITIQPGASYTLPTPTVFTVKDDGKIQFSSLVTGTNDAGGTLRGLGTVTLTGTPEYYLEFRARAVDGEGSGSLVPAGTPIEIQGTVRNLTDTATEDVGPLYAKVSGNAGLMGLRYDGVGIDPRQLSSPGALTLDPGQSKQFTLKILTAYSEPIAQGGVKRSGGTRATVEFTPWATVHLDDGTDVTTAANYSDILTTDTQRIHNISIDDSIPIPEYRKDVVAGAILYGGIQGIWDAASGMVTGLISLPGMAASVLLSIVNAQNEIWDSFTPAEREAFSHSITGAAIPVLQANLDRAREAPGKLIDEVNAFVLDYFTKVENEAGKGNYAQMVALYSSFTTNALAQLVIPVALGKLATSAEAVDAVAASQDALQSKLATLAPKIEASTTMRQVATTLLDLANGVELDYAQVAKLYGISEEEAVELQKLAAKYKWALTVRSRAASSIDWIENFQAMVKPEALKIKSVSALDIKLGYPKNSAGSLIFKEPTPLIEFRQTGKPISALVQDFVKSKGFVEGSDEYYDAIQRVSDRIGEWNQYSKTYMAWSKRKWIDVSFNWDGNAMKDPTFGGTGREVGFDLKPTGVQNEFEVQMFNEKARKYVPVTGDIDPIAFTHLDGSPLSAEEHAELIDEMRTNPKLRTQHGESATYMRGGTDFIQSQFKPGEPALQIGPDGKFRVVRFNARLSKWVSPTEYNLVWDGGEVYAGSGEVNAATTTVDYVALGAPVTPAPNFVPIPLPGNGLTVGENVGRCSVRYSNSPTAPSLLFNAQGQIVQVNYNATGVTYSPLEDTCFTEGPQVVVTIQPTTTVPGTISAGSLEIPVSSPSYNSSGPSGSNGFQVGQTITIDPGTAVAETGTISAFGSIILVKPLKYTHLKGAIIVRYTPQSLAGTVPNKPTSGGSGNPLAFTGVSVQRTVQYAVLLIVVGAFLSSAGYRRRRRQKFSRH